jgi:hypothetical protein
MRQGKGVPMAFLEFVPDLTRGNQGFTAQGQTDAQGAFTLRTGTYGTGAMPGAYKVVVNTYGGTSVPEQYTRHDQTPLATEIPDGGLQDLVLTIQE